MTSNNDNQDFLDMVADPTVKQILRKQINDVAFNDGRFQKKLKQSKQNQNRIGTLQRNYNLNIIENQNNDQQDYEQQLNPYKRQRDYQFIQPERFKKIGYTYGGAIRKPIFKMTDLYLPPNNKVQKLIDSVFKQKIYGRHNIAQLQTKFDNTQILQKIYNNWQTKQDYDQFENDKNQLNQKQLEQIVVNMGDKKQNYFLLIKNQKEKKRIQQYKKKKIKNLPISNPNFLQNFRKEVTRLSQKNKFIQQFQSQQQISDNIQLNGGTNKIQTTTDNKLFGAYKFSTQKVNLPILKKDQIIKNINLSSLPITQEKYHQKNKNHKSFNQELIRYFSYSNNDIVSDTHKGPLENLNRIQYHLANNNFFLPKLHTVLQRNSQNNKIKQGQNYKGQGILGRNLNLSQLNKSKLSDSFFTGNRQQISKPSMIDENGQQIYPLLDEEQQTIQKRIQTEIKNIYKEPLHHSQVATKFQLVKFTLDQKDFNNYHRYDFPYHFYFKNSASVKPVYHKPRKIKAKDLIINIQMKNSNIKYSKVQSLSLSEGQFIFIQYLQEHPLVMSNVGMCQRMFIQVNYQEMLEKINQDMISNAQIDDFQEMRDNPQNKNVINNGFQRKCQLWRNNMKQVFGDHGKLFLWQPKNAGKLIGSPQGLGVAVMESNLSVYPIFKKKIKQNPRDFLLVREGDKWFIRKIQNLYLSGQVEPKKKIFNPDSRDYAPVFKEKYKKAFMLKQILTNRSVNFEKIRQTFIGQSQASLKKPLKAIRATTQDNKNYTIVQGLNNIQIQLTIQDVCLYERMQKSICMLKSSGIKFIKNNQKMKNVLKQFNKRNIQNLQKFAISRMIKDQLLLTSWYLTDSFLKFKNRQTKIQIIGMADPTNGKGGYSYINKPQKQRTARQDMEEKGQKQKVSGTTSDLRKLKTNMLGNFLISRGHSQEDIQGKGRWGLVSLARRQDNTQYARKQRQTKIQKVQNEKKQISRVFNKLLNYLNDDSPSQVFNYNFKNKVTFKELLQKQKPLWQKIKNKMVGDSKRSSSESFDGDNYD